MKLSEKIILCRKKQGLSQSDLACLLNVSRQSVSKWETNEAKPDTDKLVLLSKIFEVSIDWLLDESKEKEEVNDNNDLPEWINKLPKNIVDMFKKYGWIYGVYASIGGFVFIGMGILVRVLAKNFITSGFSYDVYTNQINNSALEGFNIFSNVIIFIGAIFVIFDLSLAIILKSWGNKNNQ